MDAHVEVGEHSPFTGLVAAILALGLVRAAGKAFGLVALLIVVMLSVGALTIGIVVLRLLLLH
jgi:hypothetical protein